MPLQPDILEETKWSDWSTITTTGPEQNIGLLNMSEDAPLANKTRSLHTASKSRHIESAPRKMHNHSNTSQWISSQDYPHVEGIMLSSPSSTTAVQEPQYSSHVVTR